MTSGVVITDCSLVTTAQELKLQFIIGKIKRIDYVNQY